MTIKDQLNAGMTPKQLLDDLNKQIVAAQRELDAEKKAAEEKVKKNSARTKAEANVVAAMKDYFSALGITPSEDWEDNFKLTLKSLTNLYDSLSTNEEPSVTIKKSINGKEVKPSDKDVDEILKLWKNYFG